MSPRGSEQTALSPLAEPQAEKGLLRILFVEDVLADVEIVVYTLEQAGFPVSADVVVDLKGFDERLRTHSYDIVLADYNLPNWNGLAALEHLQRLGKDIPFILVTGTLGEETAVECLKRGAADYVLKDRLMRLPAAVQRALEEKRLRAERARTEGENLRLRTAIEQAAEAILITDAEGRIEYVNPAFTWITGYSSEEVLGQTPRLLKAGVHDQSFYQWMWETIRAGKVWQGELTNRRKDGSLFTEQMTIAPVRLTGQAITHYIAIKQDVTERQRAEQEINRLFTLSQDLLCVLGFDGYFKRLNPAWHSLSGFSHTELRGQPYVEFIHPDDRDQTLAEIQNLIAGGSTTSLENRFRCQDGSYRWLQWTAYPIPQEQLVYAAARDVTERKHSQEQIEQQNKELELRRQEAERANRLKDEFLSMMSHELRTPLNVILGFSELLADEALGPLKERQRRYLTHIRTGGEHLLQLINDLLDLSRIEAGRLELAIREVGLEPAIAEALQNLRPLANKKSLRLSSGVEPGLVVRADPTRLRQILMNLVGNAIKFTPEGGQVELTASRTDGQVRVEVRDTGPGVPPEEQTHIFKAFYQLKQAGGSNEGTGLGLTITQRLVGLQGGQVGLASLPGQGSRFFFTLPAAAAAPPGAEQD